MAKENQLKTTEEVAQEEKARAIELGLPDPYFDFREYFVVGDTVYYAYINDYLGEKEVIKMKIRTIYARTIIGYEDNAGCHVVGYKHRDRLFKDQSEAKSYIKDIKVTAKYGR